MAHLVLHLSDDKYLVITGDLFDRLAECRIISKVGDQFYELSAGEQLKVSILDSEIHGPPRPAI